MGGRPTVFSSLQLALSLAARGVGPTMEMDALEFRMQNDVSILLEEGRGAKGRPRSNTGVAGVSLHQICTLLVERKAKGLGQV